MSTEITQIAGDVSVIICAYTEQRWDDLVAAIESVKNQTLPPREIIVVIDHNPHLLMKVQEHVVDVLCVENKNAKGLSGARNSGAAVAQGEVIAFLDDDAIADSGWLQSLTACYTSSDVAGVCGKINPRWPKTRPFWFPEEFDWVVGCTYQGMTLSSTQVRNMIGANMSIRKDALMAVGGFREEFGCNHDNVNTSRDTVKSKWLHHSAGDEETEFCIRVLQNLPGATLLYTQQAHVQHRVSEVRTKWSYFSWRCYDEGLGKAMLVGMHGSHLGLSSERTYTFKVLPQGITHYLGNALLRHDGTNLARVAAILAGLTMTIAGYVVGKAYQSVTQAADYITKGKRSIQYLAGHR